MSPRRDADFSPTEIRQLAGNASFRCSWPLCPIILIGPGAEDDDPPVTLGEAGHISSASQGGPRYEEDMDPAVRKSALQNGIWLCPNHATVIDKNDGSGYSQEKLWEWRHQRERWAKAQLTGDDTSLTESPFIVEFDASDWQCAQRQSAQHDLQLRLKVTNVTEIPLKNVTCQMVQRHPRGQSHFMRVRHDNEPPYRESRQGIRIAPGRSDYFDIVYTEPHNPQVVFEYADEYLRNVEQRMHRMGAGLYHLMFDVLGDRGDNGFQVAPERVCFKLDATDLAAMTLEPVKCEDFPDTNAEPESFYVTTGPFAPAIGASAIGPQDFPETSASAKFTWGGPSESR
jgi:hypothetical protein